MADEGKSTVERFGAMLKRLVDERGLVLDELSRLSGVSKATLRLHLQAVVLPRNAESMEMVEKIADALEVDPNDFIEYRVWRLEQALKEMPGNPVLMQEHRAAMKDYEKLLKIRGIRGR